MSTITSAAASCDELLLEAEKSLANRQLHAAIGMFYRAEQAGANPDCCSAGRWMAYMLLGDFAAAWRESDAIEERKFRDADKFLDSNAIAGKKIIVRCLHGFGDTVQFLRYASCLEKTAANVIWELQPALMEMAPYFYGIRNFITWNNHLCYGTDWDVQLEVMDLPYLFRTTIEDLPLTENYIQLPDQALYSIANQMDQRSMPRIGLVWQAGEWNPARSIPFHLLEPILQNQDCEFWNLQGGSNVLLQNVQE
ncbi:MAG TPA: hypothetical protein VHB45_01295 [Alloacidobacterium sp.]|nr:hypothetical protein [Alloacidobacterium sp.]